MYADLSLRPGDTEEALELVRAAARMGYRLLGIEESGGIDRERVVEESARHGATIVWRRTIVAGDRRTLAAEAKRGRGVLLVAEPLSLEAARYAATSKAFHVLRIRPGEERLVDRSTLRLFRDRGWGAVEVSLRHLLGDWGTREWRYYSVSLRRAHAYNIEAILVSDAREPLELWHPYTVIGVAVTAGLPLQSARMLITSTPQRIARAAGRL